MEAKMVKIPNAFAFIRLGNFKKFIVYLKNNLILLIDKSFTSFIVLF